jgi:quinol monooxygenase YgiN
MSLRVIATLTALPGKEEELRETLAALLQPTREEDGCLGYELLENKEDPTEFRFVEEWTDDAALDEHFGTPHIQAAIAAFEGLLAADLDVRKYRLVG